jgi:hypothetical protein
MPSLVHGTNTSTIVVFLVVFWIVLSIIWHP